MDLSITDLWVVPPRSSCLCALSLGEVPTSPGYILCVSPEMSGWGHELLLHLHKYGRETYKLVHSQYGYFIWEWRFHSITAAMGFPLREKIKDGYPIIMKFIFSVRMDFQFLLRMALTFWKGTSHEYLKVTWRSNFRSQSPEGQLKFKVIPKANSTVTRRSAKSQGQILRSRSLEGQL